MLGFSFSFLRRKGSETEEPDEQGRKKGRKGGRKEASKEGRHEHGRSRKRGNSLEILWKYFGGISAGGSETEAPDERGWTGKRGNSLGGARLEGASRKRRTSLDGL